MRRTTAIRRPCARQACSHSELAAERIFPLAVPFWRLSDSAFSGAGGLAHDLHHLL